MSKSLSVAERRYINKERDVLAILHYLEKFHDYYFPREVIIITDHKPLVAIFKKIWTHYFRDYSAYN